MAATELAKWQHSGVNLLSLYGMSENSKGIKVAWATVLQEWTGSPDVVFGQLITPEIYSFRVLLKFSAPALNTIPVRVQQTLKPDTSLELLRAVQSQHAESIRFEIIGWNEIVGNCTKWSSGTKLGSVVVFQNYNKSVSSVRCPARRARNSSISPLRISCGCLYFLQTQLLFL